MYNSETTSVTSVTGCTGYYAYAGQLCKPLTTEECSELAQLPLFRPNNKLADSSGHYALIWKTSEGLGFHNVNSLAHVLNTRVSVARQPLERGICRKTKESCRSFLV